MALKLLVHGQRSSIPTLSAECFTKENYGVVTNTTLAVTTPKGVLGGTVAAASAGLDYVAVPGSEALMPLGLFLNDAAGAAFENSPSVASDKIAIVKGQASVEVDVYETRNAADDADLVYAVGTPLYASDQGFLTNEVASGGTVIGIVTKAPSTVSPTMGLDLRI